VILQADFKEVGGFLFNCQRNFIKTAYNAFRSLEILEETVLVVAQDLHSFIQMASQQVVGL